MVLIFYYENLAKLMERYCFCECGCNLIKETLLHKINVKHSTFIVYYNGVKCDILKNFLTFTVTVIHMYTENL